MLKNIFGFEYLIAPYTIAHLKLSQYLADKGHPLRDGERLQVFLTNALEPIEPQKNFILPELTKEVEAAQRVKDQSILVITGNPPYSYQSRTLVLGFDPKSTPIANVTVGFWASATRAVFRMIM